MRLERHIFGSFKGYTTLAKSPGVSAEDSRALESAAYSFGQSSEKHFLKSLSKTPAYFTRILSAGRRGLTRVLEGKLDDNDRPTLCLMTLIVAQRDWDAELCGDVSAMLDDAQLWRWDGGSQLSVLEWQGQPLSRTLARKSAPRVLALLSEVERACAGRRAVVISEDDYCLAEVRAVEMLVPPAARRSFTSGYRSLSAQLPVTLNCLASGATGRPTFRHQNATDSLSAYARFLEQTDFSNGVIPVEQVASYRGFGVMERETPTAAAANFVAPPVIVEAPPRRGPLLVVAFAGAVIAAAAFFGGKAIGEKQSVQNDGGHHEEVVAGLESANRKALSDQANTYEDKLAKAFSLSRGHFDDMLTSAQKQLEEAHSSTNDASAKTAQHFYEHEKTQQTQQFSVVRNDLNALIADLQPQKMAENRDVLSKMAEQLRSFREEWPVMGEEEKAWVNDVKAARAQVGELADAAPKVNRVVQILAQTSAMQAQYEGKPEKDILARIRGRMGELARGLDSVPDKLDKTSLSLVAFKENAKEQARQLLKWCEDKEKADADAHKDPSRTPPNGKGPPGNEPPPNGRGPYPGRP